MLIGTHDLLLCLHPEQPHTVMTVGTGRSLDVKAQEEVVFIL